ncbi:hypothetical protein SAMN05216436_109123 [bacterium A37T11]|nr:hypothetical protein SAMN05216436_109123 [bacterium A37T11]
MFITIPDQQVISILGNNEIPLTKNQQEFNRLNKQIARLKLLIETDRNRMDVLYAAYMKLIPPLAERDARLRFDLARIMADRSFQYKWPKNEWKTLSESIAVLCGQSFAMLELTEDELTFYHQWVKMPLEVDKAEEIVEDDGRREQNWERKKSKKTLEKELQEQNLMAMQQRSIRSVYLTLAKALHPDKAASEEERLQKEELIKRVTGAYQNKDLPALLLLESEWVALNSNHLASVGDDKLLLYIHALKVQVKALKGEHAALFDDLKYVSVLEYSQVPEKKALQHIRLDAANRKRLIRDLELGNRSLKKGALRKEILDLAAQIVWQSSGFDDWGIDEDGQRVWDEWSEEKLISKII